MTYLGCVMDETMCGEPMALKGINKKMENWSFFTRKIVFWHIGFEECYAMPSYNHIFIMHAPRGTLTLMQNLNKTANNAK